MDEDDVLGGCCLIVITFLGIMAIGGGLAIVAHWTGWPWQAFAWFLGIAAACPVAITAFAVLGKALKRRKK